MNKINYVDTDAPKETLIIKMNEMIDHFNEEMERQDRLNKFIEQIYKGRFYDTDQKGSKEN